MSLRTTTSLNRKDISILYIDNDELIKNILLKMLKKSVIKITMVSSSKKAMKQFKKHKFDLIITALDVQNIDGFKILKKIRKIDPDIHAIIFLENCTKQFAKGLSDINILNDYISRTQGIDILKKLIKKNIKKTIKRRDYKEVYSLLSHYKVALDESWIVLKMNIEGVITYVNNNFCKTSGYNKEETIGKHIRFLRSLNQNDNDEVITNIFNTISGKNIYKSELKYVKKGGDFFYVKSTIIPVINNCGDILEYISISFDITNLKNSLQKSQEARKAKSFFLANMSHEIRTPLNSILGFSQLLKKNGLGKNEQIDYVEIINRSASSLLVIINEILDISKIESGKLELENSFFEPSHEFTTVAELFSTLANEKNISYILYLDPNLPKKIYGDSLRIKQILINLISNAIKFTPIKGEIYVEIKVLEKKDTCKFSVCVKDSGIGIELNKQKNIFKPFEQANNTITRKFGGTGLGLSISHNVLELMNSKIELISEINKGSTFSFVLETKYEDEEICYAKELSNLSIGLYTNDTRNISKHIKITQHYIKEYAKTSLVNKVENISNYDVLIVTYTDYTSLKKESFVIPTIIINSENINLFDLKVLTKILKTPITPTKTYNSILDVLQIPNNIENTFQEKTNEEGVMFNGNVLIAEDDETNQQLIQILLESKGITVDIVNDGKEAIEFVTKFNKEQSIDFILMDINMPLLDGIKAAKKIKEYETQYKLKHIPIIALTANALIGDKEKYLKLGMDNYLSKPIKSLELQNILCKHLRKTNDIKKVSKIHYSFEDSAKLIGISTEKFITIFKKFITNFNDKFNTLKLLIRNNEFDEIRSQAHSLKGASGNLNIMEMYDIFEKIEIHSKDKKTSLYIHELDQIKNIHTQLQEIIKNN